MRKQPLTQVSTPAPLSKPSPTRKEGHLDLDGDVEALLRAAHQLDPRRLCLGRAAIGRKIIQRHAPCGEARLELLAESRCGRVAEGNSPPPRR